ncbi:hypothetical protein RJ641_016436 [Dillenia turbinata]|uniref:Uncharacterized protein n=1 Tax=Dillenia turbinata TaxID=194707 RepID=A0AAN8YWT3_9MAGN
MMQEPPLNNKEYPLSTIWPTLSSGPCFSYQLRKRALHYDMSRYTCCAGYMPCSGKCGENQCPYFCLATEVLCCFGNSVASTRFILQDEFNIQMNHCDSCIISFMFFLRELACIFSFVGNAVGFQKLSKASWSLLFFSDMVYCMVSACMQSQHYIEMESRDHALQPPVMEVPPMQEMSRLDQPVPPVVGYPVHLTYGLQPYPPSQPYPPPPGHP